MQYELQKYVNLIGEFDWLKKWIRIRTYKRKQDAVKGLKTMRKKARPYERYRLRIITRRGVT